MGELRLGIGMISAAALMATLTRVAPAQTLVINEIDYDQFGNDTTEFIELRNSGDTAMSLANISVVLINGADGHEYARYDLAPLGSVGRRGFIVLRTAAVEVPPGTLTIEFPLPANNIQNGSPDGVAVVNTATGELLDSLSYEGAITNAVIDGLPGEYNLVHGTMIPLLLADLNGPLMSLARVPDGRTSGDDLLDWQLVLTPSPGWSNTGGITNCGSADFDGDGDTGTDADIEAFFRCLAGDCCATCWSHGADFDADGDAGTDADIEAFFRVLAGSAC